VDCLADPVVVVQRQVCAGGRCIERHDGETFFSLPNSNFDWMKEWFAEHNAAAPPSTLADSDPCPF